MISRAFFVFSQLLPCTQTPLTLIFTLTNRKKSSFRVDFSVMIWEQPATLMLNNAVIEVKEGSGDRIGIS